MASSDVELGDYSRVSWSTRFGQSIVCTHNGVVPVLSLGVSSPCLRIGGLNWHTQLISLCYTRTSSPVRSLEALPLFHLLLPILVSRK